MLNLIETNKLYLSKKHGNKLNVVYYDVMHGTDKIGEIVGRVQWKYTANGSVPTDEFKYEYRLQGAYNDGYVNITSVKAAMLTKWRELGCPKMIVETEKVNAKFLTDGVNDNFYPTPSKLAGLMLSGVDFRKVSAILEPSAGKGDLIDCFKELRNVRNIDVDCIEIDTNLRYILEGKEYRVVFDDFLRFNSGKRYDLILMNPPFSDGAKHLLKALQLQRNGGQICCLLNAETLRNPCTNERTVLVNLLQKYNARIKYVSNSFKKAERKTDVEVAIVWVDIPVTWGTSNIFEGLQKAHAEDKQEQEVTDIISGDYIQGLIDGYNTEVALCREFIREYEALQPRMLRSLNDTDYNRPIIELKIDGHDNSDINVCLKAVRIKYWNCLMTNEELLSKFTDTLRSKYAVIRDEMKDYDFNMFNIQKVLARMRADIVGGLQEEIYKIFDKLSSEHSWYPESKQNVHYYNGWQTNKAHKVGMKAIIPAYGCFATHSWDSTPLNVRACYGAIADIEKVFNYLNGTINDEVNTLTQLDRAASRGITKNINCKYFTVTFYKKGTVHIKMLPETEPIIDALNIYVCKGKKWLPPHYGKVAYDDMTAEEQAVVDSFQGKDKYEQVMQNPQIYLYEDTDLGNRLMLEMND